ncbi:MAG: DHH family phosphoesterase [Clostridia bacterium]|nr:DHH family phosphoesterase [Clostridia bacterium]
MPDNYRKIKRHTPVAAIVCATMAVIVLGISAILMMETEIPPATIIYCALGTYLFTLFWVAVISMLRNRLTKGSLADIKTSVFGTISLSFVQSLHMPVLICDEKGKIVWYNEILLAGYKSYGVLCGKYLDAVCSATLETIAQKGEEGLEVSFLSDSGVMSDQPDAVFCARSYRASSKNKIYYTVIFENVTEMKNLNQRLINEEPIIAYAMIDNLDELTQYVQELYSDTTRDVENILRRAMEKVGGIVRNYGHNKFLLVFESEHLVTLEKDRFSLLDEVREIRVGSTALPVTLSMGIAKIKGSLYEKERATQAALDMALQRGGDQVVVKSADKFDFYGGKTKTVQKQDKVRARVIANELLALISSADNVIVMGHKYPDFDAFASCIAIMRLAKFCGVKTFIVCDKTTKSLEPCFRKIAGNPEYENVFVNKTEAQDLIRSGTLAVVVDVNNIDFCEAPDVVNTVSDIVVIDHHRKTAEFKIQPKISYIEPSASSASELLCEFLEQIIPSKTLPKIEADFLLAGIFLDTKNFTHNTGTRTFSSAMYLRGEGANPLEAKAFFNMELEDFRSEASFETNVIIHKASIALAINRNEDNPPIARVNASRAADRLLNVSGVKASFALCRIGESVHISGRSQGKINVQLILEKLGGGGHFDSAGAQVKNATIEEAEQFLYVAIDEYFVENHYVV